MSLKRKHLNPRFSSLFITISTNKGLGEQHYIGVNKRDQELREKEDKARELMKSVIINESDPNNGLSKSFSEFFKMNVKIAEQIAVYEQSVDDLPSIFNDNNLPDKKQSTPREVSEWRSEAQNQENLSADDMFADKQNKTMLNTMKVQAKENKRQSIVNSTSDNDKKFQDETIAIVNENYDNSKEALKISTNKLHRQESKETQFWKTINSEREVPLLTKQERLEIGSVLDHYECEIENENTFVLTPRKSIVLKQPKKLHSSIQGD